MAEDKPWVTNALKKK